MKKGNERQRPLYARVSDKIIAMIKSGEWEAGARLPSERELAEKLGVSRTSVREAIRLLSLNGMLSSQRGAGTFVLAQSPSLAGDEMRFMSDVYYDQEDLHEFRAAIEVCIIDLAARRVTKEDIRKLKSIMYDQQRARDLGEDETPFIKDFHLTLAKATKNSVFVSLMRVLNALLDRRRQESREQHLKRRMVSGFWHHKIIEALELGDVDACRLAMSRHMEANIDRSPTTDQAP